MNELVPYFEYEDKVRLYLGDCASVLKEFGSESVDMIFADPPYGLSNDGFTCHAGKRVAVNKGEWDRSRGVAGNFEFHFHWLNECKRVLKPNGTLWVSGTYHSIYLCGKALLDQGWHIINDICWYKPNAAPNLSCRMFTASHETIIWAKKSKKAKHVFNYDVVKNGEWDDALKKPGRQMRSVWVIGAPRCYEKRYGKHPTQKPESLLERIVLASTNEGDVVLDPFCGSATTGVVSVRWNRKFVGIDSEEVYLKQIAIPRIVDELEKDRDLAGLAGSQTTGCRFGSATL